MKKIIFIVVILFTTLNLSSQVYTKRSEKLCIDYGRGYSNWEFCDQDIKIDFDNNQISIISTKKNEFNIFKKEYFYGDNHILIVCKCSDFYGDIWNISISIYNKENWYIIFDNGVMKYDYRLKL